MDVLKVYGVDNTVSRRFLNTRSRAIYGFYITAGWFLIVQHIDVLSYLWILPERCQRQSCSALPPLCLISLYVSWRDYIFYWIPLTSFWKAAKRLFPFKQGTIMGKKIISFTFWFLYNLEQLWTLCCYLELSFSHYEGEEFKRLRIVLLFREYALKENKDI